MANYNLTQTGDEVQAYIDSIPVIEVTGTLSGSNIVFATNPYSQIAANYAADCGSVVRLTVGTKIYIVRISGYDGTNYTGSVKDGDDFVSLTIGSSSASGTISSPSFSTGEALSDVGIDATPTQGDNNLVTSGKVAEMIAKQSHISTLTGANNSGVRSESFTLVAGMTYRILIARPNIPMDTVTSSSSYLRFWIENESGTVLYPKTYMGSNLLSYYDFTPETTQSYKIGMRANANEVQTFFIYDITSFYNLNRIYVMPDEWGVMINSSGTKVNPGGSSPQYKGVKYIEVFEGEFIEFNTSTNSSISTVSNWAGLAFSTDKTTWTPVFAIPYAYDDKRTGVYRANEHGWLAISGDFRQPVWYKKVDALNYQRCVNNVYYPFSYNLAFLKINVSDAYNNFYFAPSTSTISICVPIKRTDIDVFFNMTNDSYTAVRYVGLKNHVAIKMEKSPTVTSNVRGTQIRILSTFLQGIDEVFINFSKNDGYSASDYEEFGVVDTYESNNVYSVPTFGYSQAYNVGDLVTFRSGKVSLITKTKTANNYPAVGGIQDVVLLDTRKLERTTSVTTFMTYVAQKAVNIGMTNSTWLNPYGGRLYGFNYTTGADLLKLLLFVAGDGRLLEFMGCESANVTIYGAHERTVAINNDINTQFRTYYSDMHSGATCPYRLIANKAGAHTNETDVHTNGFALLMIAEVEGKLVAAVTGIGDTSLGYAAGRERRVRGMVELLDICAAAIRGESISGMSVTYCNIAVAALLPSFPQTCATLNVDYLYSLNPTTEFMPASVSKVMAAIGMLDWVDMYEFHSIWQDTDELVNDSDFTAYAGDVQSVKSSFYAMLLASEGANTLSLARLCGEKIIRQISKFLGT